MSELFPDAGLAPPIDYRPGVLRELTNFEALRAEVKLVQRSAAIGGRMIPVPRLEGWWAPPNMTYTFGGRSYAPRLDRPPTLLKVWRRVEELAGESFEACFANLYRGARDSIPWHSDNDWWIGPVIASASFGGSRRFQLRRKDDHKTKHRMLLSDGDLLIMGAGCQEEWEHSVPRESGQAWPRFNLTFRQVRGGRRGGSQQGGPGST